MIRIALADDQAMVRSGLALVLGIEPDLEVVAQCADGAELLAAVRTASPDVVLTDVRMPRMDGAEATRRIRALPDGLDTRLGTQLDGVGLSGGQWQRLALARVHLRRAGVWVLDEPTSAIDAEAEQEVFAELRRQRADRVTIVVSHRAWTLREMDHIYVFDAGRVVEEGRYADLLAAGGRFAEIFAAQT